MNFDEYQRLAYRTADKALTDNDQLINACLGIAGKNGKVSDLVKKYKFQGHDLKKDELREELGDVLWYLALAASAMGWSLGEVARVNIEKLERRFPGGVFSAERSIHRGES